MLICISRKATAKKQVWFYNIEFISRWQELRWTLSLQLFRVNVSREYDILAFRVSSVAYRIHRTHRANRLLTLRTKLRKQCRSKNFVLFDQHFVAVLTVMNLKCMFTFLIRWTHVLVSQHLHMLCSLLNMRCNLNTM